MVARDTVSRGGGAQVPADGVGAGVQAGRGQLLAQLDDQVDDLGAAIAVGDVCGSPGAGLEGSLALAAIPKLYLESSPPRLPAQMKPNAIPSRAEELWVDAESAPVAEPAVQQRGQLAGKEPKAFTAVNARQLVEQSGRHRGLSSSQDQCRSRGPVTVGKPLPQTFGILVTIERVTGTDLERLPSAAAGPGRQPGPC